MTPLGSQISDLERQLLQAISRAKAQAEASALRTQQAAEIPAISRTMASLKSLQRQQSSMVRSVRRLAGLG